MDALRDPPPASAPRRGTASGRRYRGIFTKLVIIFLVVGLVPFLAVSFWTYHQAKGSMTEEVIEYWLVRLAREGSIQIDLEVQGMREQVLAWATDETLAADIALVGEGPPDPEDPNLLAIRDFLRHRQRSARDVDLILLLRDDGCIVASSLPAEGEEASPLVGRYVQKILPESEGPPYYTERQWITDALGENERDDPLVLLDCHVSRLREIARGEPQRTSPVWPKDPRAFSFGFARPISVPRLGALGQPATRGALVVLYNWARIHDLIDAITARFQNLVDPRDDDEAAALAIATRYDSGYPFLFADDMDTVIGHRYLKNLGNSLSISHGHPKFRDLIVRARNTSTPFGTYAYEYPEGTPKISGFALTRPREEGGFGWSLGVGINGEQIYKSVLGLRTLMTIATLIVVGMVLLLAAIFSHRITEPITRLIAYTSEVARGNLDARVHIGTKDEIEVLADSFNDMVKDLKEANLRLIEAEKNAAWREMARQVAHDQEPPYPHRPRRPAGAPGAPRPPPAFRRVARGFAESHHPADRESEAHRRRLRGLRRVPAARLEEARPRPCGARRGGALPGRREAASR